MHLKRGGLTGGLGLIRIAIIINRWIKCGIRFYVGKNVWFGSGVQIMPGITVGDNSVIGAGSVATSDIPANVVAYAVPCRVVREIGEKDRKEIIYLFQKSTLNIYV